MSHVIEFPTGYASHMGGRMLLMALAFALPINEPRADEPKQVVNETIIVANLNTLAGIGGENSVKQLRDAGAFSPAALPVYFKLLNQDPPLDWSYICGVLGTVRKIDDDRTVFRPVVEGFLSNSKQQVSHQAIQLLEIIGVEESAPAVASQLRRKTNDDAYYTSIVKTLAVIGTEKEIELLDEMKETGLLKDDGRFWMKVADCKKAIQARADAKKKLKAKGVNDK